MKKRSKRRRPKFKVCQPVFWGNGVYQLFFVLEVNPLHCPDGCFSYRLSKVHPAFRQYTSSAPDWYGDTRQVSEDVLLSITRMPPCGG